MEVPLVSCILIFRNNPERAEQTLQALLPKARLFREIVVMDDGSKDLTGETISSLMAAFPADNCQFYANPEPAGRGVCINQVLPNVTAPFLWLPSGLLDFDADAFASITRAYLDKQVLVTGPAISLVEPGRFVQDLSKGEMCTDAHFVFNLGAIPPRELFANPFLDEAPACEWAARILVPHPEEAAQLNDPFFVCDDGVTREISAFTIRQMAWSLLSTTGDSVFAVLAGLSHATPVDNAAPAPVEPAAPPPPPEIPQGPAANDRTAQNIVDRVSLLIEEGRFDDAEGLVDMIDDEDPVKLELQDILNSLRPVDEFVPEQPVLADDDEIQEPVNLKAIALAFANEETGTPPPAAPLEPYIPPQPAYDDEPEPEFEPEFKPAISVVIPTTIDGRNLLEACLVSIEYNENPSRTELIVVNNASLDDTEEYLLQLAEVGFFNIRVINNPVNRGVAAAWNQGLQAAQGDVVVFLHNDAELMSPVFGDLEHALRANTEFGVVAAGTLPPGSDKPAFDSQYLLLETNTPASVCFAMRRNDGFSFDERYGLAWFEDADLFMQMVRADKLLGKLDNRFVFHYGQTTTTEIGEPVLGTGYYFNRSQFNQKWGLEPALPAHLSDAAPVNQLLAISELINPFFPEPHLTAQINQLLSAEVRTEILSGYWEREILFSFIRLFAATDHRDLSRSLEEKASSFHFQPELLLLLIDYYYRRTIFSRCEHYLNMLTEPAYAVRGAVYRLSMQLEERRYNEAVEQLTWLLENAPVNPDVLALAARLNHAYNELDQADAFYQQAHQLQPVRYTLPAPYHRTS